MIWKYYMPHVWQGERTFWEDVYLLPELPDYTDKAIWLTVDALGFYEGEHRADAAGKLGEKAFVINGTDMIVRGENFSKPELLEWVRVWLAEKGLPVTALVEAPAQDFRGKAVVFDFILAGSKEIQEDEAVQVHVDPDTFAEIPGEMEKEHKHKIVLSRKVFDQIAALPPEEAERIKQAIRGLADNPAPEGLSKKLRDEQDLDE